MAYPSIYTRLYNFLRDQNNGLESPAAAKVDAELNNLQLSLAQAVERLRTITTVDGKLRNVPAALAAALVDTWEDVSDGTDTVTTDIPWTSTFSVDSVLVLVGSVPLRPSQITSVQTSGGFLQLTLAAAPVLNTTLVVWAYEPGAGLLTRLAAVTTGDGAALIGVEDARGLLASANAEDALAEIAGNLLALQTAIGNLAEYFKRDGSVAATADFDLDGFKVTNAADGVDPGDYLTVRQMANYIAAWSDLSRFFLKRDGTTAMAGNLNFGNNKGYNLADPDLNAPLDSVNVRAMLRAIAVGGASPVGTVIDYIGTVAPTLDWLLCDGQLYAATAYPILSALLPATYRTGSMQNCVAARCPKMIAGTGTDPGDVLAGVLVLGDIYSLLVNSGNIGRGYATAPVVTVRNPGGADTGAVVVVTVSDTEVDGAVVTLGGEILTAVITSGGAGVLVGAYLEFSDTLEVLPAGYFRTPDLRGRVTIGAGTESKSPGITNPPSELTGDAYNATARVVGASGGEEEHLLTAGEIAPHLHPLMRGQNGGSVISGGAMINFIDGYPGRYSRSTFADEINVGGEAHQTMPPFHVLNKLIKAK